MPGQKAYIPRKKNLYHMTNDWQNTLQSLLNSGDLPEGQDVPQEAPPPVRLPKLTVSLEKKGRGGKTVTIISGFDAGEDIRQLASLIKNKLATGGSARGGEILIQGDRREDVRRILTESGYK